MICPFIGGFETFEASPVFVSLGIKQIQRIVDKLNPYQKNIVFSVQDKLSTGRIVHLKLRLLLLVNLHHLIWCDTVDDARDELELMLIEEILHQLGCTKQTCK